MTAASRARPPQPVEDPVGQGVGQTRDLHRSAQPEGAPDHEHHIGVDGVAGFPRAEYANQHQAKGGQHCGPGHRQYVEQRQHHDGEKRQHGVGSLTAGRRNRSVEA